MRSFLCFGDGYRRCGRKFHLYQLVFNVLEWVRSGLHHDDQTHSAGRQAQEYKEKWRVSIALDIVIIVHGILLDNCTWNQGNCCHRQCLKESQASECRTYVILLYYLWCSRAQLGRQRAYWLNNSQQFPFRIGWTRQSRKSLQNTLFRTRSYQSDKLLSGRSAEGESLRIWAYVENICRGATHQPTLIA